MKKPLFAIVDIETTGSQPRQDRITEIAIALHDGREVIETYETLINPERPIPRNITNITGITDEMVADAPRFHEVARRIVEMTEGAVFVAHNVRFDYHFLQAQYANLGYPFKRTKLCTIRLARKAFPGLRRYGLDSLSRHFNIHNHDRHRAMGDVMATIGIFERVLQSTEPGLWKAMLREGISESMLPVALSRSKIEALPDACGVYYFHNKEGEVLYVGKSLNIRKRVVQHFNHKSEKALKMQHAVDTVSYKLTGSELISLLLETSEIKKLQPMFNVMLKSTKNRWCVYRRYNEGGYLEFSYGLQGTFEQGEVVEVFSNEKTAKAYILRLARQQGTCSRLLNLDHHGKVCFNFHVKRCRGACNGTQSPESYNQRMAELLELNLNGFEGQHYIIDRGRNEEEKSVILIENGMYKGFGFSHEDDLPTLQDQWSQLIEPAVHYPDHLRIIHEYMLSNQRVKHFILPGLEF